jgi:hypothetical protein
MVSGVRNLLSGTAGADATGVAGGATRVVSRVAQGAGTGGTAAAVMSGSSDAPMSDQVLQGMKTGAVLGPVLPLLGSAAGYGQKIVQNMMSPITDMLPGANAKIAVNRLVAAFQKDGMSPEQAIARVKQLGPGAMLADAGGANVRSMGETVASVPGAGSNIAQQSLEDRAGGQVSRVNQAVKDATGAHGNVYDQASDLIHQRSQAAAPLYDKAMAADVVPNEKLGIQLQNPLIQQALKDGSKIAETEAAADGVAFDSTKYANPDGTPSMRALDAGKRGLDDMLEKYRDTTTGKMNLDSHGRAIEKLRQSYV